MSSRAFLLSLSLLPACRQEADEPSPFVEACTEVFLFGSECEGVATDPEEAEAAARLYCIGAAQVVGLQYDPSCIDAVTELGACISALSCDVFTVGPAQWPPDEGCLAAYQTAHEGCASLVPYCIDPPVTADKCHLYRPVCLDAHTYAVDCDDPAPDDAMPHDKDCTCRRDGEPAGTFVDEGTCRGSDLSRLATEHCDFPTDWL